MSWSTGPPPSGLGLYLHIPFCRERCDYCAFATWSDRDERIGDYLAALATEINRARDDGVLDDINSVFVGGGTPSRLEPDDLAAIVGLLAAPAGTEITVECNPEDLVGSAGVRRIETLASAGVNRISLGVQSTAPAVLAELGRRHGHTQIGEAIASIAAGGITNVNTDLIFGSPVETDEDWHRSVTDVLGLDPAPTHVSLYALSVEAGTVLYDDPSRHPDDDRQAVRYEMAEALLDEAGYHHYEISNWARPGHECVHNANTWRLGNYRGFGASAHSHVDGRRFWNIRTIERYVAAIEAGQSAVAGEELLGPDERALEALMLGLRTAEGVEWPGPVPDSCAELVERSGTRMTLTARGRLLHSHVVGELSGQGAK